MAGRLMRATGAGAATVVAALLATFSMASVAAQSKNSPAAYKMTGDFASLIGRCWFAKGDSTFAGYSHASETNAIAGPPRVLLVEKKAPDGRPALVIEFKTVGSAVDISVYGPLAAGDKAPRIQADLQRWATGGKGCS
jgi:hypothetical protein